MCHNVGGNGNRFPHFESFPKTLRRDDLSTVCKIMLAYCKLWVQFQDGEGEGMKLLSAFLESYLEWTDSAVESLDNLNRPL
jgi:hypothetical protein